MFHLTSLLSLSSSLGGGGGEQETESLSPTTNPAEANAQVIAALRDRGVNATQFNGASRELVTAWIGWYDQQTGAGPGALVQGIRSGRQPPASAASRAIDEQRAYLERVVAWLQEKMPDVCKPDPRVVEDERVRYGEPAAARLAGCTLPHPAAIGAVLRLHATGKKFRVKEHGELIRRVVRAWDDRLLAGSETKNEEAA